VLDTGVDEAVDRLCVLVAWLAAGEAHDVVRRLGRAVAVEVERTQE